MWEGGRAAGHGAGGPAAGHGAGGQRQVLQGRRSGRPGVRGRSSEGKEEGKWQVQRENSCGGLKPGG